MPPWSTSAICPSIGSLMHAIHKHLAARNFYNGSRGVNKGGGGGRRGPCPPSTQTYTGVIRSKHYPTKHYGSVLNLVSKHYCSNFKTLATVKFKTLPFVLNVCSVLNVYRCSVLNLTVGFELKLKALP